MDTQIYLSKKKYCELKNIKKTTYYYLSIKNKIPYKTIVKKGSKKHYLVINSKDIIIIKSDKNGIIM